MAQNDLIFADDTFPNCFSDLNAIFSAIKTNQSGTGAPSSTAAGMIYYNTTDGAFYVRNSTDSGWIQIFKVEDPFRVENIQFDGYKIQSHDTHPLWLSKEISFDAASTKTISSGSIGIDQVVHMVDTQSSASTDDLDTISAPGSSNTQPLILYPANTSRTVVIRDASVSSGNIQTPYGRAITLTNRDYCILMYNGTHWQVVAYPHGASPYQVNDGTTYASLAGSHFFDGNPITWQSVSSIRVPSGFKAISENGDELLVAAANLDVSLSAAGALGLDTGSEASDTWYYIWLCKGGSGTTAIFSTSSSSPTLPSGYTDYKRRLPVVVRNDASSNILPFVANNFTGMVYYSPLDYDQNQGGAPSGTTLLISNGAATSFTAVDASDFVPPQALMFLGHINVGGNGGSAPNGSAFVRPEGSTVTTGREIGFANASGGTQGRTDIEAVIHTDSNQGFDYRVENAGLDFTCAVMAYPFI